MEYTIFERNQTVSMAEVYYENLKTELGKLNSYGDTVNNNSKEAYYKIRNGIKDKQTTESDTNSSSTFQNKEALTWNTEVAFIIGFTLGVGTIIVINNPWIVFAILPIIPYTLNSVNNLGDIRKTFTPFNIKIINQIIVNNGDVYCDNNQYK